jgi:hypothetical protein
MSWQKCPICEGTGVYPGPGTFSNVPTCPTCKGKRIISTVSGQPPIDGGVYVYSQSTQKVIEPAVWPNQSYTNSNTTHNVRDISTERPQLQEPRSERIDPVD